MLRLNPIILDNNQYEKLLNKKIVKEETNGITYEISSDILYKIYNKISSVVSLNGYDLYIDYETNIDSSLNLRTSSAQDMLPKNKIYIDGKFKGVELSNPGNITDFSKSLKYSYNKRLKIIKELLIKIQYLLDNNIYPINLDNNLVLKHKKTFITDLEGENVKITSEFDDNLNNIICYKLYILVLELLTKENVSSDDVVRIEKLLNKIDYNYNNSYINRVIFSKKANMEDVKDLIINSKTRIK